MHPSPPHAAQLRHVAVLVEVLASKGLALRRFDLDPGFFGSFQLEFARGHSRARLTWDGRERVLSVEHAAVMNQGESARWQVLREMKCESSDEALAEVESQVTSALSSQS